MPRKSSRSSASGFSLIELLIAMVVTSIISGAIYGLIASGQTAFRREPELVDRQQNIRMAMDLIVRDVGAAGVGLSLPGQTSWVQAFSRTSAESGGALESCVGGTHDEGGGAPCPDSPNKAGERSDDLEIVANPDGSDPEEVCGYQGAA